MADTKISGLVELTVGNVAASTDFLAIVDTSATETKKATPASVLADSLGQATSLAWTAPTAITVNSATTALRVTQTGAGNALLVEDSANPDSTPFVVNTAGQVLVGHTAALTMQGSSGSIQQHGITAAATVEQMARWTADALGPVSMYGKSRSGVIGTQGVVASGDPIGEIRFVADDGTAFIPAASIVSFVDGTPGTNDMPGRIVFSTTADGAATVTERMRIDSVGAVGIGASGTTGGVVLIGRVVTGATTAYTLGTNVTVQSDVTTAANNFSSFIGTLAAAFSLVDLRHFHANQGTIGAGSAVTNQIGFSVMSSLIGATNNYGFYGNIASGSGRWNFYANGTARNFFAGGVEVLAGTTAQAAGFLNCSAAAGVPTGVPTNPTGNVPIYYDTTNNKLYVYNGAWRATAALT